MVREYDLDALSYYYHGSDENHYEQVQSGFIVGHSLLTADGVPCAGEGDIKTCAAMKICDALGLGGSFSEIVAMDYVHNTMLLGHDGPFHISISNARPMLRGMGVKVIEIPTDPETGISVEALELALEQWPIKGIILVPNCNNPLGFIMPDARKRAVLSLAQRHDIVIFEDDVYGELATEYPRPRTIHSWDIDGRVLLCSSFSKSIAPGLRVGWVAPGRYHDKLMHMKYAISSFNVPSTQMAAATFVLEGHYHRHIRRMRQIYQRNLALYTCWIREYFPCEICITRPKGGFLLWIELPEQVDMVCVARQLCRMKIQVAAGSIFSASGKYRNCLRINCALPLSETYREALKQIGEAVYRAME